MNNDHENVLLADARNELDGLFFDLGDGLTGNQFKEEVMKLIEHAYRAGCNAPRRTKKCV